MNNPQFQIKYAFLGVAVGSALMFLLGTCSPASKADNLTISLPDYNCSGSPTGWTISQPGSTTARVVCASSGTAPPPGAPTGCVATLNGGSSPITLSSAGGTASLAATCTTPASPTWNWSRNGTFGESTAASFSASFGANGSTTTDQIYLFQVRACNGAPCVTVPSSSLSVTVQKASSGGWNGTCPGFASTKVIPIDWNNPQRMLTSSFGGFGIGDAVVVKFTTGNISSGSQNLPRLTGAEYNSPPSSRTAVLSATPCDFSAQSTTGSTNIGNSITAIFALGTGTGYNYYPILKLNTEYYLNVKNNQQSSTCASASSCDMFFEMLKTNL